MQKKNRRITEKNGSRRHIVSGKVLSCCPLYLCVLCAVLKLRIMPDMSKYFAIFLLTLTMFVEVYLTALKLIKVNSEICAKGKKLF